MDAKSVSFVVNPPQEDFEQCVELVCNYENWKLASGDYNVFLRAFPNNFWLTVAKDKEKVVGLTMVSTMSTLEENGEISTFSGFFVHPDYRGYGIGSTLFRMALDSKLKAGKNVNLNALNEKTSWYVSRGIKHFAPTPNTTFTVETGDIRPLRVRKRLDASLNTLENLKIVPVEDVRDQALVDYDKSVVPVDRSTYIPAWLRRSDAFTRVSVSPEGEVRGFACLRSISRNRLLYSPIFAKNERIAEALVLATIDAVPHLGKFTDVVFVASGENLAIENVIERLVEGGRFHKKSHVHRMFSAKVLTSDHSQIFAFTSYGSCCV